MNFSLSDLLTPQMLGSIVRSGLMFVGVDKFLSGDQLTSIAGAITVFVVVGWSLVQKKMAANKQHEQVVKAAVIVANDPGCVGAVIAQSKAGTL